MMDPDGIASSPAPAETGPWSRARNARFAGLRVPRRYRVPIAGLTALPLAALGEYLMRADAGATPINSGLGICLIYVAVFLVGFVAWGRTDPASVSQAERAPGASERLAASAGALRDRAGAWFGWTGTGLGLAATVALAMLCWLLLREDFAHPLAPLIWIVMLAALVLTFVGSSPWPAGESLSRRDRDEPAVSRGEWVLLGLILLVATAVRLWHLDSIPAGPYADEADRAIDARHLLRGEPVNRAPFVFFGTGWWGVPSLYFWLVARSMQLFGDNLTGARTIHALAGIVTVWYTYRIGRLLWSPRAGLIAGALLAVSDFAIQFSRTAGESTITILTWTVCFYYLFRAVTTRRPIDWVLSGLAAGFTLYGYASGKLLPVCLVLAGLFLLLRWGRAGLRLYLPGLALLALAAILTYGPNALYILAHPDVFTMRSNSVSIFTGPNTPLTFAVYHTHNWLSIIGDQFRLAFSAFDVGREQGPFYPTGQPVLPIGWAALWILGTAYVIMRVRDARFALLGLWLLFGLAGAALTTGDPTLQRTAGMVPTLALIPAAFLDRVTRGIPARLVTIEPGPRVPWLPAFRVSAVHLLLAALVAVLGFQTLTFYFGSYAPQQLYYDATLVGRYAQTLDPARDIIYQMDIPVAAYWYGPTVFLADRVRGGDLVNAGDDLPLTGAGNKNVHFLVFPSNAAYLPILREYYPGGRTAEIRQHDGTPFCTVYRVDHAIIAGRQRLHLLYRHGRQTLFRELAAQLGTTGGSAPISPAAMTYPADARWSGGLIVPAYGVYRLRLRAPGGARLTIDGQQAIQAVAGRHSGREIQVVLAKGVHQVVLDGTLLTARDGIALDWGAGSGALRPVAPISLWDGPLGVVRGTAYGNTDPAALTTPRPLLAGKPITIERRDGVMGWHSITPALYGNAPVLMVWDGTLRIRTPGRYLFAPQTDGAVSIWVDGGLVGARGAGSGEPPLPGSVTLAPGAHRLEIRFRTAHDFQAFELYWRPPFGAMQLLPPSALGTASGGIWSVTQRPAAPVPASTGASG